MKVLQVSTKLQGGAGKSCLRLHQGLRSIGVDSALLTLNTDKDIPEVYNYIDHYKNPLIKWQKKLMARTIFPRKRLRMLPYSTPFYAFDFLDSSFDITTHPSYKEADLIHLHWTTDFLDYPSFFKKNTKPLVWTMHDSTAFTGGYPLETNFPFASYETVIRRQARQKKKLYQGQHLNLITPSTWMSEKAKRSELMHNTPIHVIPNAVDTDIFCLSDKTAAREQLNLPQDSTIVLFVADCISDKHKGMDILLEAIDDLDVNGLLLVIAGRFWNPPDKIPPHRYVGEIADTTEMASLYNAADVFVIPSIEDNFPNTVIESLCCGTPVVGFKIGGIAEQVTLDNGRLCSETNAVQLRKTLLESLADLKRFNAQEISDDAKRLYAQEVQARQVKRLYEDLINYELRMA